jgi:hypothetical protein
VKALAGNGRIVSDPATVAKLVDVTADLAFLGSDKGGDLPPGELRIPFRAS